MSLIVLVSADMAQTTPALLLCAAGRVFCNLNFNSVMFVECLLSQRVVLLLVIIYSQSIGVVAISKGAFNKKARSFDQNLEDRRTIIQEHGCYCCCCCCKQATATCLRRR